ncbi:hypothetical protein ANN_07438 [Periplaneta americana]|uniref:Annexin n=1 Tax=Periplaneta americana TaxID=6978 RepID=A0ABQ8SYQ9_PERAM|nr:hypothetical protein ANN_07438 [Periplaneta americana]
MEGLLRMRILDETVNADRHCDILNEIVVPVMQVAEREHYLSQQDDDKVYAQKLQDVDMLKIAIEEEIHAIPMDICYKSINDFPKRQLCLDVNGELKVGTDEEVFNRIMAHESFPQLKLIFEEYKNVSGRTIEQALEAELSGELLEAMLAIVHSWYALCCVGAVECVQSPPAFFAKRLHDAMAGAGTDDVTMIRIIVCRSEIDLANIKEEFERIYDKTLESAVRVRKLHGVNYSIYESVSAFKMLKFVFARNFSKVLLDIEVMEDWSSVSMPPILFHRVQGNTFTS